MAKATKVPVTQYTVTLELDREEAELIRAVVGTVYNPNASRKGEVATRIFRALQEAGIENHLGNPFVGRVEWK